MTNILLEGYDLSLPWLYQELKGILKPKHTVAVIALAFRDNRVRDLSDWNALYGKEEGKYYRGIVESLSLYGITAQQISFINYFEDTPQTAKQKIADADILYFPGGLPDRMMERIHEMELYDTLMRHDGIVMGYSAGALLQLAEYHLTPDEDYPEFCYEEGLPYLSGFYLEPHYESTEQQKASIARVLREKNMPVYATEWMSGALIVTDENLRVVGEVEEYSAM